MRDWRCAMRRNLEGIAGARLTVIIVALLAATVLMLRSLGTREPIATTARKRLEASERDRESTTVRAKAVVARAAEARVATKPAVARANALHERVHVVRSGQLLVEDADAGRSTLVPVPSVVTERIQADSVAISALSVAL